MIDVQKLYDVIVIGAGPSGSSTGIAASRMGLSTVILEAGRKGRDKYCGGGLTPLSQRTLREIGAREALEAIEVYAEGHVLVLPGGRLLVDILPEGAHGLVRRSIFDAKLQEVSESLGADVRYNFKAVGISVEEERVVVESSKGETAEGRYLVIASGVLDRLADALGFPPRPAKEFLGHCWGTEAPYPAEEEAARWRQKYGITPIFLMFGFVTYGYMWVFPKKSHMNVGMGTTLKESAKYGKKHIEGYNEGLKLAAKLGILSEPDLFKVDRGWLIPGKPRARTYSVKKRTLLVGDAAGFVHPLTGEGISGALRSGWIAANVVKEALDREDPSFLATYQERWWRDFGEEAFKYGARLTQIMYTHPLLQKLSLEMVFSDEKATKLLSSLLGRTDPTATRKFYSYVLKHFPELLVRRAVTKERIKSYSKEG
jgi:geranylgeranyl reductase family protein